MPIEDEVPNSAASIPPVPPPSHVVPTVSAWTTPPVVDAPLMPERPHQPSLFDRWPWWAFGVLLLAQVGFSIIFTYMVVTLGKQMSSADDLLDAKIERVIREMEKEARGQDVIKQEQTARKEVVARVPGLLDTVATVRNEVTANGATMKVFDAQIQTNRQDIEQLRRNHDALVARVQDLTYMRQPKIGIDGPQP